MADPGCPFPVLVDGDRERLLRSAMSGSSAALRADDVLGVAAMQRPDANGLLIEKFRERKWIEHQINPVSVEVGRPAGLPGPWKNGLPSAVSALTVSISPTK